MEELITLYERNKTKIEGFIEESISNIPIEKFINKNNYKKLFSTFSSLELVYMVDKNSKMQTSPNIFRNKTIKLLQEQDRSYLCNKLNFKGNLLYFSPAYISAASNNVCITVTIKNDDSILFMDFKLEALLEKLNLIELNKPFHTFTKAYYCFAGFSLALLSVFIVFYSMYSFLGAFIGSNAFSLEMIFKPIVSLTLALAIFDLAKTILEQEVFFKSYTSNSKTQSEMFIKFLITIIIALSIESLMLVFKIALGDYTQMINALYLIIGVSLIIISLSIFIYFHNKKNKRIV